MKYTGISISFFTSSRILILTLISLFYGGLSFAQDRTDEIKQIKQNYKKMILASGNPDASLVNELWLIPKETVFSDQMVVELMERYKIGEDRVRFLLGGIQEDGSWSDIDYANKNRSGWQPKVHVERILELIKVYYTQDSPYYQSKEIEDKIHLTLKFWFDKKLVSLNWWHNQIGVPKVLGAGFILFEDKLTPDEKKQAIGVMKNSKFGMTGQNKVWLAGNVLVRALLEDDIELVKASRDTIFSEIRADRKEGIKPDNSFHQHGAQQQFGNYGAAYISSMNFWIQILNGTSMQLDQPRLDILSQLINEGYARILWKGYMDINALGRQFFHQVQRHKAFTVGFVAEGLEKNDLKNKDGYRKLLDANFFNTSVTPQQLGLYHFWMSDQTVYRQPKWMASVKMSSRRVIGGESGNGDNLKGYYLADGATYIYVDGDEYNNAYVCWDWRKVPGITSYETNTPLKELTWGSYHNQSDFVGSVTNEVTGITVMDFKRDRLSAKKSWVFTEDFLLCLGTGIQSDSNCIVTTSVDQRIKKGDMYILEKNDWKKTDKATLVNNKDNRIFNGSTGYIIMQPANGEASVTQRTGSWNEIMTVYPKDFIEQKDIFSLYLNHGYKPENGSYQYVILPASTMKEVKDFKTDDIRVINNTASSQAVFIKSKNIFYIAMYIAGEIRLDKDINLKTSDPGLFLIRNKGNKMLNVTVCDPTQKLNNMVIEVNGNTHAIVLPQGDEKGTSVGIDIAI